ncbi:MAG: hypothetical protein JKY71_02515 [Alphaproteobacteria bacterium]|nr:hypothetical protein [Alphaproteobacteria bacterium]
MRVVNVPIAEAVLFVPPDGVDRDPDLSNDADRAAMRKIRAQDYIQARDGRNKPDWMQSGSHRLYCPCCVDKGHLSRHMGVRSHDRPYINFRGQTEPMHRPASFVKRHDGLDHLDDCEFANRYDRFDPKARVSGDEIDERRRLLDKQLHTISIPTGDIITMPPRRIVGYKRDTEEFGPVDEGVVDPRSARSPAKAPPLNSIDAVAAFIIKHRHDPDMWNQKLLGTPDGPHSLNDIFLNSNKSVLLRCQERLQQGDAYVQIIASLTPNRIAKYREGRAFPSQPTGKLAVLFSAQNEEAMEHMKTLFSPKGRGSGQKVLAYGLAGMREDGRPEIKIFRPEQITSWQEPSPQIPLF